MRLRLTAAAAFVLLAGCQTVSSTIGETYDRWFGGGRPAQKPAELVPLPRPAVTPRIVWQASVGGAEKSVFFPAVSGNAVFAAGAGGQIAGFEAHSGKPIARIDAGQRLSGGVGVSGDVVLAGTAKGEVLAFERSGKLLWKAQLSGEVLAPPQAEDGVVVARAGDGRLFGLDIADGRRRWVYQRQTPALSVRSHAGVLINRGAVFAGFPGGRLVAIALANGNVGWEAVVALPRGATELERVADVASLPVIDERQVCAVAYQGRVACFDPARGATIWARDASSIAGMALDARNLYLTDDKNAVVALDKANGASLWRQDRLAGRGVSAPLAIGRYVVVGDFQGYVHFLSREDGSFAGRIATDGSAIGAPPVALDFSTLLVQTRSGGLFAISAQ
jgi:outer membrane protein assembly factor BamB